MEHVGILFVKLRKAKTGSWAKGSQAGHLRGSAFTLTFDLTENDTKFRYVSVNLPWTTFAGMFYLLVVEREIGWNSLREQIRHKSFGSLSPISNVKHTMVNVIL